MGGSRKRVKTYSRRHEARRAARSATKSTALSSPLRDLPTDEDVSRSELARRLLKRSRRASEGAFDPQAPESGHPKRTKHAFPDSDPDAMTLDDFHLVNPNDPSQFQTPLPSQSPEKTSQSSAKVIAPDDLSPLPVGFRISRTSSRNFKENKSKSKRCHSRSQAHTRSNSYGVPLESPFHSRPSSRTSSPKKAQSKPAIYRTHSDTTREPIFTMNQSAGNSPRSPNSRPNKPSHHNRVPSLPTSMPQESIDWLVPARSLSLNPLKDLTPDFEDDFFDADGSFYGGVPLAYSTPLPKTVNAPDGVSDQDVIMQDPVPERARKQVHHSKDSIFSDSDNYSTDASCPGFQKQSILDGYIGFAYSSSPTGCHALEHHHSFPDPTMVAQPPWNVFSDPFAAFEPVIASPPASPALPQVRTDGNGKESPVRDELEHMLGGLELHSMLFPPHEPSEFSLHRPHSKLQMTQESPSRPFLSLVGQDPSIVQSRSYPRALRSLTSGAAQEQSKPRISHFPKLKGKSMLMREGRVLELSSVRLDLQLLVRCL
jgi:hypothetical protein